MSYQHILYETKDKIATITLNRPDRMNAWTPIMERDVRQAMETASADDNVRVIVLTGAGRAFCAGADVGGLEDMSAAGGRGDLADKRPYSLPMSIGKPIVAAIRGPCIGIGVQQALCCDVRFAAVMIATMIPTVVAASIRVIPRPPPPFRSDVLR